MLFIAIKSIAILLYFQHSYCRSGSIITYAIDYYELMNRESDRELEDYGRTGLVNNVSSLGVFCL